SLLFSVLAISLMLGIASGNALAQGDNSVYFVTYYSNARTAGAPNAVLRLINDGDKSTTSTEGVPNGNLWASIYVFDDSQEFQECCSCEVTPDGLTSEWTNTELLGNSLTGKINTRGVIKVVSSSTNPGDPTNNTLAPGIRGWMTHIQATGQAGAAAYALTETSLADSNLSSTENGDLENLCSYAITLGSGRGTCSCTPEDHDF
ncbi:MAG: hypothetical protein WBE23_15045, partial [Candidatus Sulfotelmatobacter sp.]